MKWRKTVRSIRKNAIYILVCSEEKNIREAGYIKNSKRIKEQYASSFTLLPYKICEYTKRIAHTRRRSGDIGLVYHIFRVFSSAVRVFGAGYKRKAARGAANTEPWTAER